MINSAEQQQQQRQRQQQQQQQQRLAPNQEEIWEAVGAESSTAVERLKDAHINICIALNAAWPAGFRSSMNIVMKAAYSGLTDILKVVITAHPSAVDVQNEGGLSALMLAVLSDNLDCAKLLIDAGASLDLQDNDGNPVLKWAVTRNSLACSRLLVEREASLKHQNNKGVSVLMTAVINRSLECVQLLIRSGAALDLQDQYGMSALNMAVFSDCLEIAKLLISGGAALDLMNGEGWTALMRAIRFNNPNLVELLLKCGAAVDLKNNRGQTALDIARNYVYDNDVVDMLLKQLKWLSRRGFLMFLATQSYLPAAPPPLTDSMSRGELNAYYQQLRDPEIRPNTGVHSVFFMEELQRYVMSFIGSDTT